MLVLYMIFVATSLDVSSVYDFDLQSTPEVGLIRAFNCMEEIRRIQGHMRKHRRGRGFEISYP